jgi:hypothetical protein
MPVTKKKGAIFAIHADTPDKIFNDGPSSAFGAPSNATSPIKKEVPKRKALVIKQSKAFPSEPLQSEKDNNKPAYTDDLVKPRTTVLRPKDHAKEKRHRVPSADQPRPTTATTSSVQTPSKKARVLDQLRGDVTPANKSTEDTGSPASRTRSKTKNRPAPSPHQRIPIVTSLISIHDANTVKRPASTRRSAMSIFADAASNSENIPPAPVPINKQVLDKRRGNAIIDLLELAGEDGPEEEDMQEFERAYDENIKLHRMTKKARAAVADGSILMPKLKGKGKAVKSDGVLGDVSEAYGASGSEPKGFKEQRSCR